MKWITSLDLERWADTIGSRARLSELVRDLISASVSDIGAIRFPTGDTSQMPGWDGHLVSSGAQPYVPVGESGWEFGTDKGVVAKANADYKTRSENAGVITKDSATFVFVTPRKWTDGELWAQARSAEGVWKRVQILDVVALEDWLNDGVPLAASVARECLGQWYGENATALGAWRLRGRAVLPQRIKLPSLAVIPDQDRIVPPGSALALAKALPDCRILRAPIGHIGMMSGGRAEAAVWRPVAEWIAGQGTASTPLSCTATRRPIKSKPKAKSPPIKRPKTKSPKAKSRTKRRTP